MSDKKLILASGSASRATLLRLAGIAFEVCVSGVDEAKIKETHKGTPYQLALALAAAKAAAVYAEHYASSPDTHYIIAADQLLVCDEVIFDKPPTMAAARQHLEALRGRTHQLIGGVVLYKNNEILWQHEETATLTMRDFSDDFLDDYLDRAGEAILSSVGAYQLEGLGVQLFSEISGDHSGILGLPLLPLLQALRDYGLTEK